MLKYVTYDIVFQEFPDEVTLAVNLSLCPHACPGCHSAHLQGDVGEPLTEERLLSLVASYEGSITCVALMGGDNDPGAVVSLLSAVRRRYAGALRTGWYSGDEVLPAVAASTLMAFDYVKLGPYRADLGPLSAPTTNQRLYRVDHDRAALVDVTHRLRHGCAGAAG